MAELTRGLLALAFTAGLGGCGMLRGDQAQGPPVPKPVSPVQKAVADEKSPDAATIADFNARLEKFVKVQRALLKRDPVPKDSTPAQVKAHQDSLASQLRNIRKDAKQGDIFTPQVAALFKRLINPELKGTEGRETKQALEEEDGEVAVVNLKVNASWPAGEPLTTTPANILANLPQLPPDVEYRISNKRHLVLRDVDANIIVDYIFNAIR